jgi:hypothetical protein
MNRSPDFQGLRWYKCDLHMHTPADSRHWRGRALGDDPDRAAEDYIRRCYECGLEVIAITDHNFASKSFLPRLSGAIKQLSAEYGYSIVLFPGFEINADVGRGMHVLALFEPRSDFEEIDHALTNCGVPMPRQKVDGIHQPSTKRLPDIIKVVQKPDANGYYTGIVICPHPTETGIFDNDRISEWLQQHEWKNPALFAVEVPKPITQLSHGWQCLFGNGHSCREDWKRPRSMAAVMSSDAKAFTQEEDADNYIGRRFCWIKMSVPSIESLRQAFLDPESRICLESKPLKVTHTHVQSIEVTGTKFLRDQTVVLSPHLNCLIGGRGSGKSMLFESMRLGLRGEMAFKDISEKDHVAARQVKRLRGTFQKDTIVTLKVFHDDLEDVFVVDNPVMAARIENREADDPLTVFRRLGALIFSQEEITQLAGEQKSLLDFIDGLARDRIEKHRNRAQEIIDRLKAARQIDEKIQRLDGELVALKQEAEELGRQLAAKTTVQEELKRHRAAQVAKRYLDGLTTKAEDTKERLIVLAEELETEPPPLGSRVESFPNADFFRQAEEKVAAAYQQLAQTIKASVVELLTSIEAATSKHADWPNVHKAIEQAEKDFHAACDAEGLTTDEAEKLRETEQQHRVKQAAYQAKQVERDQAAKQQPDIKKLLEELTQCWLAEKETRQEILDEITGSDTMPRTEGGAAIVKTSLTFAGDRESFLKLWGELSPARNTKVGRLWDRYSRDGAEDNIGDKLFDAFLDVFENSENSKEAGNPVQWLEVNWDNEQGLPLIVREYRRDIDRVREEKSDKWFELLLTRIPDAADLILLRTDGSAAGSFQQDDLSTGQKNTAILSLLLARGHGPVLIDQPEDELDSEFLFRELVPMFRKAKKQRQLIIVTHNANIPVNADAELVYALKAEGGRGLCRTQGGLDRPDVTRAVLDIMEGSEEAFRRRKEKYHF